MTVEQSNECDCSPRDQSLSFVDVGRAESTELGDLKTLEVRQITLLDSPVTKNELWSAIKGGERDDRREPSSVSSLSNLLNHICPGEPSERLYVLERLLVDPGTKQGRMSVSGGTVGSSMSMMSNTDWLSCAPRCSCCTINK